MSKILRIILCISKILEGLSKILDNLSKILENQKPKLSPITSTSEALFT